MNVFIKKIIFVLLSIIMLSCGNNDTQKKDYIVDSLETSQNINALNIKGTQNKILIAYFTWSDNTVVENPDSIDVDAETSASVLSPGNAELIANWIAEETGGDLFSIKTQNKYYMPNGSFYIC